NIWCAVIFQGTASPIEVDLDEFYGKSHRTMEGERFSVSLNKRGDVLEIHRAGAYSQKNIMGSVWKA
ncbi:MAG: hypothetical protein GWO40_08365, partial [Gammaproteobacteria bacterium]|nr:hypothetical protein [Gammaproteobacteria bacterium]NIV51578.1 hypothetical protein [Gammaproteobacteria bacterium]NIX05754.1 hypothetical protein [Gammaproteobacteria bacterium]NIX85563.1 hypothetical protein [Gammaproteobacteria bacterium]